MGTAATTAAVTAALTGAITSGFSAAKERVLPHDNPPAGLPFTVTWRRDSDIQSPCQTYVLDKPPEAVPLPPHDVNGINDAPDAWAASVGASDGAESHLRITIQGDSDQTVVLQSLKIVVVERAASGGRYGYRANDGCGAGASPRYFDVDLESARPVAQPVVGQDESGKEIPAVAFPFTVSRVDPEIFEVYATSLKSSTSWFVTLEWSSGTRTGVYKLDDHGKPFLTRAIRPGTPVYLPDGNRWRASVGG
jgi:hypothetical protein